MKLSSQEASDVAAEFYDMLRKEKYSSNTAAMAYAAVRSFFSHNGVRLERWAKKFSGKRQYEEGKLLTQKEVFNLVEAVPQYRDKAAVAMCFQAGQRDGVPSALRVKHIGTRHWEESAVVVVNVPAMLPNRNGLNVNKWQIPYRFGVLNDTARFIRLHLEERERKGESITPDSWLFRSFGKTPLPIMGNYINVCVKRAAERTGIQRYNETARVDPRTGKPFKRALVHAHIGRIYFKTQMRLSGVDAELTDFMMGHKPKYDAAYDRYLESEIVKAMEQARNRLILTAQPLSELERRKQAILDNAALVFTPEKLEKLKEMFAYASTNEEFESVLDDFRNGRGKLEPIRR